MILIRIIASAYCKVPKFSDTTNFAVIDFQMLTKRPNCRVIHLKDANGRANSEDPDQTAPRV